MKSFQLPARATVATLGLLLGAGCSPPAAPPPNVLLISVDTLRADRLGCYGAAAVETPAIDALARDGIRFGRAFTPVPLTLPAHWTLHTGFEPWHHGVIDNGMVLDEPPAATLAERFSAAGYDTAAFVAAYVLHSTFGLDRGFGRYDDGPAADAALDQLIHATAPADERVGRVLGWLNGESRRQSQKPFFLWLHLFDPHAPYSPPSGFRSRYRDRPYDGEVAFADSQIARLMAGLERLGLAENTLIVLTADHGESLGEHGEQTHGILLYDATLHVPLIFRLPRKSRSGGVRDDPATLADVAPTVLALAGLPPNGGADGRDLFGGRRESEGQERRLGAVSESPRRRLGWAPLFALREGPWKFIAAPRPELYRLDRDPGELHDLLDSERRRAADLGRGARQLEEELRARLAAGGAAEPSAETRAALAALGYVGGESPRSGEAPPDPKVAILSLGELDRAYQLFAEGKLDAAEALFRGLLDRSAFPAASALEGLARIARLRGDAVAAEKAYLRLLAVDPANTGALAQLVTIAREGGDAEGALAWARRLQSLAPRDGAASRLLAEALLLAGDPAAAEREWRRGLAAAPKARWLRLSYARFLAAGRAEEARRELDLLAGQELPADLLDAADALRARLSAAPAGSGSP